MACGNLQIRGRDYGAVYAPVVDFGIIRLMAANLGHKGWLTRQVHVKKTFLHKDIFIQGIFHKR